MPSDGDAGREGGRAEPGVGAAQLMSISSSGSRATLRYFRMQQRQQLAASIALTGLDRGTALRDVVGLAEAALCAHDADAMVSCLGPLIGCLQEPKHRGDRRQASVFNDCIEQDQLRDMILRLLGVMDERGLDTNDLGTRKLLKLPFKLINSLLPAQNDLSRFAWREQWMELSRVASRGGVCPEIASHCGSLVQQPRRRVIHGEAARVNRIYEPNSRVKGCGTVIYDGSDPKVLQCSKCSSTITSAWYFVHPTTGKREVLVPNNGHQACRTHSGQYH